MKRWWQKASKDYFTFSVKERNGLLILLCIALSVYLASRYYPASHSVLKKDDFQKELASLSITVDSSHNSRFYQKNNNNEDYNDYDRSNRYERNEETKGELFVFDPNTLDEPGWQRLGLHDRTISTIQKFISKGYKFRKPEDISKIYGLKPAEVERLLPYIQIAGGEENNNNSFLKKSDAANAPVAAFAEAYKNKKLNINTVDTTALIALPGIGSKLANRIIMYREKLGGFVNISQFGETYGLQDSIFQKIKPRLQCIAPEIKQININNSDAAQLKVHPYIKWNIANAIVNYRTQHGNFQSLDELKKIDLINDELLKKLRPYLIL